MIMKIKSKLQEKRGDSMLIWVVLSLIVVMSFQGHANILNQTSMVNELQQQMDISGLNALNGTVDFNNLREEVVLGDLTKHEFDTTYGKDIEKAYRQELINKVAGNPNITSLDFVNTKVEPISTPHGKLGSEHILLDSVVSVKLKTFGNYNPNDGEELIFEVGQNGSTKLRSVRRNDDGSVELFLQNQTRIKYQ